jgi:hypothetical protein
MGKVIFEYDDTEDFIDIQQHINAGKLQSIIWDFDQKLRSTQKYECKEETTIQEMRDLLREIMEDNGINFEHEIFR